MIHFIDKLEAQRILEPDKNGTYHGPRPDMEFDQFIVFEDPNWVAIDNTTGNAWTEEFPSVGKALAWLCGKERDDDEEPEQHAPIGKLADPVEDEPTALANSGAGERDYSKDDGTTGNLSYDFETALDQDRILHLHASDVELTELMTSSYEKETGKSCVTWLRPGYAPEHESLPRPDEYETRGYTENFWQWIKAIEKKAIEAGVEDVDEMAAFFMGYLWPEAAELRGKKLLEKLADEEPSCGGLYKPTLGEVLPLIHGKVEIHVRKSSDLTWSALFNNSMAAIEDLSKQDDGKLLGRQVVTVRAYSANATFTCGSLCLDGDPKTIVEIGG